MHLFTYNLKPKVLKRIANISDLGFSHTCTCLAIFMQCVDQEVVVAAFSTQRRQMVVVVMAAAQMVKELDKGNSFNQLDPRVLKLCSLIVGIQIHLHLAVAQIIMWSQRLVAASILGEILICSSSIAFATTQLNLCPI